MEDGAPPRDVLRRRVRTAEYYRIPWSEGVQDKHFSFYDESKDSWHRYSWKDLARMADCPTTGKDDYDAEEYGGGVDKYVTKLPDRTGPDFNENPATAKHTDRRNFNIPRAIIDDMNDHRYLAKYADGAGVISAADDPWDNLHTWISGNGNMLDAPYGASAQSAVPAVEAFYKAWGVDETKPSNEQQPQYRELARDIRCFLLGDVRSMPVERRKILELADLYTEAKMTDFIATMFSNPIKVMDTAQGAAPNATIDSHLGYGGLPSDTPTAAPKTGGITEVVVDRWEIVVIRPNIEHEMLGIIMGHGGVDELGATLWVSPRPPTHARLGGPLLTPEPCAAGGGRRSSPCTTTRCTGSGA